jgi:hypothetical protein
LWRGSSDLRARFGVPRLSISTVASSSSPIKAMHATPHPGIHAHGAFAVSRGAHQNSSLSKAKHDARSVRLPSPAPMIAGIRTTFNYSNAPAVAFAARPRCDIPSAQRDLKVPLYWLSVLATIPLPQASWCNDNCFLRGQTGQVLDSLTRARVLSTRVSVDRGGSEASDFLLRRSSSAQINMHTFEG